MNKYHSRSPSSSPPCKRQRMSSPTYDSQLDFFDTGTMRALEALEVKLSQCSSQPSQTCLTKKRSDPRLKRANADKQAQGFVSGDGLDDLFHDVPSPPSQDLRQRQHLPSTSSGSDDDPILTSRPEGPVRSSLFVKASHISAFQTSNPPSSPLPDRALDDGSWFESNPRAQLSTVMFTTAKFAPALAVEEPSSSQGASTGLHRESHVPGSPQSSPVFGRVEDGDVSPSSPRNNAIFTTTKSPIVETVTSKSIPTATQTGAESRNSVSANRQSDFVGASSLAGPSTGFSKASRTGFLVPSKEAMERAAKLMERWEEESRVQVDNEAVPAAALHSANLPADLPASTPRRPALQPVDNMPSSPVPETPCPPGKRAEPFIAPNPLRSNNSCEPQSAIRSANKPKPFKTPFLSRAGAPENNPLLHPGHDHINSIHARHPFSKFSLNATPPPAQRNDTQVGFSTPARTVRANARGELPKKFVTPFKPGMAPGQPGRLRLEQEQAQRRERIATGTPAPSHSQPRMATPAKSTRLLAPQLSARPTEFFNLTAPASRKTLASSGLSPQAFTDVELTTMGINVDELKQITPDIALYYSFHSMSAADDNDAGNGVASQAKYGADAALQQLRDRGCSLATKEWVNNHWGLILWKLAGMVRIEPHRETSAPRRRWCWEEVMRQLLYRYERELNSATRPPLRLITTHDASPMSPMVLCVSNVTWQAQGPAENGEPKPLHPELEVTDGWYRLRAAVDEALARAVRRGIIRVGRKIAVAGAKLDSSRKEPSEILEAYSSMNLRISGNSSHLASWHAKLGFYRGPCIVTLDKLTPDGGQLPLLDVVVLKSFPVAYLETIESDDGQKHRVGPRGEKEEGLVQAQWQRKHDAEESKLRVALEKRLLKFETWADKLERKAGRNVLRSDDDSCPGHIDDLMDDLEDSAEAASFIANVTPRDAGWLSLSCRQRHAALRETAYDEILREVKDVCPPRDVRNFRVVVVQDARTQSRTAFRKAMLTVWDARSLQLSEDSGKAGSFQAGQRFLISNLCPSQPGAWMEPAPDAEIYLNTTKATRWTKLR